MAAVEHDQGSCMFRLPLDTGECACLQYRIEESSGIWDCYHTEVPPSQQGKGLGGVLAKVCSLLICLPSIIHLLTN